MFFGCCYCVPTEHPSEAKMKGKDERCFTWVIDILLRIPAPSSSFWILHFTLGHHICTQIFNVSLSGTAQRTLSFQETCHLCEKRETTLPYSSPWVVHHPFAHAEIVECKTAINVLTSFKLLNVMGFLNILRDRLCDNVFFTFFAS